MGNQELNNQLIVVFLCNPGFNMIVVLDLLGDYQWGSAFAFE